MTEGRKTFLAAAVLAAAVGVYVEVSHQEKLRASQHAARAAEPVPASSIPRPPGSSDPPH